MGIFNKNKTPKGGVWRGVPYTNFHDLNLDWVLRVVRFTEESLEELPDAIDEAIKKGLEEYAEDQTEKLRDLILGADQSVNVMLPADETLQPFDNTGASDNTAAFNALLQWMAKNGRKTMYFPAGTYQLGSVSLPAQLAIVGDGRYNTTIKAKPFLTAPMVQGIADGLLIDGVTLDCNDAQQGRPTTIIGATIKGALITNACFVGGDYAISTPAASAGHLQLSDLVCTSQSAAAVKIGASGDNLNVSAVGLVISNSAPRGIILDGNNADFKGVVVRGSTTALQLGGNNNSVEWAGMPGYVNNGNENTLICAGVDMTINTQRVTLNTTECTSTVDTVTETVNDKREYTNLGDEAIDVHGTATVEAGRATVTVTGMVDAEADVMRLHSNTSTEVSAIDELDLTGETVKLMSTNPVRYKSPTVLNDNFKAVPMADADGNQYNVLVQGETWPPEGGGGGGGEGNDPNAIHITGGTMTGPLTMDGANANINLQNGAKITGLGTPTAADDLVTKAYTDTIASTEAMKAQTAAQNYANAKIADSGKLYLPLTGGELSGGLTMHRTLSLYGGASLNSGVIADVGLPTTDTDAATKGYVDRAIADAGGGGSYLPLSGGTMSGDIEIKYNDASLNILNNQMYYLINGDLQSKLVFDEELVYLSSGTSSSVRLSGISTPLTNDDAANKEYIDNKFFIYTQTLTANNIDFLNGGTLAQAQNVYAVCNPFFVMVSGRFRLKDLASNSIMRFKVIASIANYAAAHSNEHMFAYQWVDNNGNAWNGNCYIEKATGYICVDSPPNSSYSWVHFFIPLELS